MTPRISYPSLVAMLILVFSLAAVACGGGEETAAEPTAAPAPIRPAAAPTVAPAATIAPAATAVPTRAPAASAPGEQTGTLTIAVSAVGAPNFVPFLGSISDTLGIRDPLVHMKLAPLPQRGDYDPAASIITGWELAPDTSSITFTIRDGVQFHHGWGEVTVEDIVWSFNNALTEGNTNPRSGFLGEYHGNWDVIDSNTAKMTVKEGAALNPRWLIEMSNTWRGTLTVFSKDAYDQLGEEEANQTFIGTGPFEATTWLAEDRIEAVALEEHYRAVPAFKSLRVLHMPEEATRVAAFKTGEVDIANISNQFLLDATQAVGGRAQRLGLGQSLQFFFGGNFWQETDFEGNVIFPREGLKADADHPWIGDPRDPDSMERSRLVRQAMNLAIDRDALSEELQQSLSPPAYTHFSGFGPSDPQWKEEWFIPFDPDRAKELLVEAGYPNGFDVPMWTASAHNIIDPEIGDAVAQMWDNIGLRTEMERTTYDGRRPTMIERTIDIPFMHHRGVGDHSEAKGRLISAGLGGANRGTELPVEILQQTYWANLNELDEQKRIANNILLEDYLRENWLSAPLVVKVGHAAVSPRVLEWNPQIEQFGNINALETVVLSGN